MAIAWRRRLRNLVSTFAAHILIALTLALFALFFWSISLGGFVALFTGDWVSGCGVCLTVAVAVAALLTCAALAIAPIWRGKRQAIAAPIPSQQLISAPSPQLPQSAQAFATILGRRRSRQESQLKV